MRSLIGSKAPAIQAPAVINGNEIVNNFNLEDYANGKYAVLFFYPMDFTFVCPTELIAFQEKIEEFKARNTVVIGCSVDSQFSHLAWLQTDRKKGGIKGVTYPLVADFSKTIAMNYGVLAGDYEWNDDEDMGFDGEPVAYRGLFLMDKKGVIRHLLINDLPLGRSVDEALRMIDALQHFEEYGEVCPANWSKGKEAMKATNEGVSEYLSKH